MIDAGETMDKMILLWYCTKIASWFNTVVLETWFDTTEKTKTSIFTLPLM